MVLSGHIPNRPLVAQEHPTDEETTGSCGPSYHQRWSNDRAYYHNGDRYYYDDRQPPPPDYVPELRYRYRDDYHPAPFPFSLFGQ